MPVIDVGNYRESRVHLIESGVFEMVRCCEKDVKHRSHLVESAYLRDSFRRSSPYQKHAAHKLTILYTPVQACDDLVSIGWQKALEHLRDLYRLSPGMVPSSMPRITVLGRSPIV